MSKEAPYKKLVVWKNLCELRKEIYQITEKLNRPGNYRLVEQMRAAARSAKQNFAEGYKKGHVSHFINFCGHSRASLEELDEDIQDCFEDNLIDDNDYEELNSLCKRTMYLLDKYVKSLYDHKKNGTWKNKPDSY
jgi:four helix bundle protein